MVDLFFIFFIYFCRISRDNSTLTVSRAHSSDSGKYTCVATNPAGEEDRIYNLNVYGVCTSNTEYVICNSCNFGFELIPMLLIWNSSYSVVPPVINGNNENVFEELTTVLDSSINIECVATGSPPPQLNWLRNGLPLPVSSHIRLLSAGQVLR